MEIGDWRLNRISSGAKKEESLNQNRKVNSPKGGSRKSVVCNKFNLKSQKYTRYPRVKNRTETARKQLKKKHRDRLITHPLKGSKNNDRNRSPRKSATQSTPRNPQDRDQLLTNTARRVSYNRVLKETRK